MTTAVQLDFFSRPPLRRRGSRHGSPTIAERVLAQLRDGPVCTAAFLRDQATGAETFMYTFSNRISELRKELRADGWDIVVKRNGCRNPRHRHEPGKGDWLYTLAPHKPREEYIH